METAVYSPRDGKVGEIRWTLVRRSNRRDLLLVLKDA